ncbi:O-acyltransferase WSD1 [Acorus calamus]|uniref:O-acyltransferase WSD1 n=1 Tax=Acorus calamus TaxID=4465 RepID=A0AAV9CCM5_ACOCL|nr:O-acyltransferase WSD1 [Acorus calamus]
MGSKQLVVEVEEAKIGEDEEAPVSPAGQYFNSSSLYVSILAVFESDVPIDDSQMFPLLDTLLPINPRFSSIMVKNERGVQQWRRVNVNFADHVKVPVFPAGLSPPAYDKVVQDYVSKVGMDRLPESRPLWELHIIKYPTSHGEGTFMFKLHHALGDGYSLMSALFSCVKRTDDPSLPLTFPGNSTTAKTVGSGGPGLVSLAINTVRDFAWGLAKSTFVKDSVSPIRFGMDGVEFRPIEMSFLKFSVDDIRRVKARIGGTVNDIICGIIFHGIQLYMQSIGDGSKSAQATALVMLNTRFIHKSTQATAPVNPKEMNKPDAEFPWGNRVGYLHLSIPTRDCRNKDDPLKFMAKVNRLMKRKKSSLGVFLTAQLLETMRRFRGPEQLSYASELDLVTQVAARHIHSTLKNTSMAVSNLIGPNENMSLANHPIRSFHFMVVGVPQSLRITIVSYMGKLKVAMGTEKGFIDAKLLTTCMEKAFARIYEAAIEEKP